MTEDTALITALLVTADGCKKEIEFETVSETPPELLESALFIPRGAQIDDLLDRPAYRLYHRKGFDLLHEEVVDGRRERVFLAFYKEVL